MKNPEEISQLRVFEPEKCHHCVIARWQQWACTNGRLMYGFLGQCESASLSPLDRFSRVCTTTTTTTTTKQRLLCFRFVRTYACTAVFLCSYRFWIVSMHMQTNKKTCTHQKHQKTANFIDNYEEHISNMSFWSGWSGNVYSILLDACFLIAIGQSAHHHAVQVTDSGECAIVRLSA